MKCFARNSGIFLPTRQMDLFFPDDIPGIATP
jgi:hypothetical protein